MKKEIMLVQEATRRETSGSFLSVEPPGPSEETMPMLQGLSADSKLP
jgi:hypothetical protein